MKPLSQQWVQDGSSVLLLLIDRHREESCREWGKVVWGPP